MERMLPVMQAVAWLVINLAMVAGLLLCEPEDASIWCVGLLIFLRMNVELVQHERHSGTSS